MDSTIPIDSFGNHSSIRYYVNGEYNNLLYAVCNSRGDVEALYGGSGKLVARYIYDTWGNTISILNSSGKEVTDEASMVCSREKTICISIV